MSIELQEKLKRLPQEPGIYLMKDARGYIIYIGKAKNLKNRVSTYFHSHSGATGKTQALVREIRDFELLLTANEGEALLLERSMIRHHQPQFNVMLRDDKEYPYIRVDFTAEWPRIEKVRRRLEDGAFYLGPFSHAGFLAITLKMIYKIFPLIRCSPHEFANVTRPCNYYHMKLCLGPCTLAVDRDMYVDMIRNALKLFQGQHQELLRTLKEKMKAASEEQKYEMAATYRDQIHALATLNQRQAVIVRTIDHGDIVGIYQQDDSTAIQVLMVRGGQLLGSESFLIRTPIQTEAEALLAFLAQYYEARPLPPELLLPFPLDDVDILLQAIAGDQGTSALPRTRVLVPQRGQSADLLKIAQKNAQFHWEDQHAQKSRKRVDLELIKETLQLDVLPTRMECIDISNLQGTAIVASNICFIDGKPRKDLYRIYTIQTVTENPDDFASIREVVSRRLTRAVRDADWPDLLLIDGGKGQLQAAMDALAEFPGIKLRIVSIAKSRPDENSPDYNPKYSQERLFFTDRDEPVSLDVGSPEYRLFTQLRDEAHRFAIKHHRKKRGKIAQSSLLEEVPGIGATLRKRLLQEFGGLDGIKAATLDQLKRVKGMRADAALVLYTKLHEE